jgi:hypothetical protein
MEQLTRKAVLELHKVHGDGPVVEGRGAEGRRVCG